MRECVLGVIVCDSLSVGMEGGINVFKMSSMHRIRVDEMCV